MVSIVGILYVHVPSGITNPSELVKYSSSIKNPVPWTKAPSIYKKQPRKNVKALCIEEDVVQQGKKDSGLFFFYLMLNSTFVLNSAK